MKGLAQAITDILFPIGCAFCGRWLNQPPVTCHYPESVPGNYHSFCNVGLTGLCATCRREARLLQDVSHTGMPVFTTSACDGMLAAFAYRGPARQGIGRMKFRNAPSAAAVFAAFLAARLSITRDIPPLGMYGLILPIPMHLVREARRGYNQAALIAEALGRLTGIACCTDLLVKTGKGVRQSSISGVRRQVNAEHACRLRAPHRIRGQCILLVDDIITTGSTVHYAARTLKEAGAQAVYAAAAAAGRMELTAGHGCTIP